MCKDDNEHQEKMHGYNTQALKWKGLEGCQFCHCILIHKPI